MSFTKCDVILYNSLELRTTTERDAKKNMITIEENEENVDS